MKCFVCKIDKLSKEFPRDNVSDDCEHPVSCCLRCTITHFSKKELLCPYAGCNNQATDGYKVVKQCQTEMDQLYPPMEALDNADEHTSDLSNANQVINISRLVGDMMVIPYNKQMTIEKLKQEIYKNLNVEVDKQQLMYKDVVLELFMNNKAMTLEDYKVQPFATIHLMILLFAIPSNFNHAIFDLFWGYPAKRRDYLDASCLIYSGKTFIDKVDFGNTCYHSNSIWHSGDVMDNKNRIGHHTIEVQFQKIPPNVSHLYFTLSAWNSPTIAHFPNPSLTFFEAKNKQKDLCKTTFTHARNSQAVIMCSVWRSSSSGQWKIFESGKLSPGNAQDYSPLINTIKTQH